MVLFLIALWMYMTQPVFSSSKTSVSLSLEPQRLELHVKMLSETLAPRDAAHPENLNRVAAYIRQEYERAGGRWGAL
jgi:hypothetical protein